MVPRSLLAGRWIVVLVCYLDDSAGDPKKNPVTTIAGYIARDTTWKAFETEVEPILGKLTSEFSMPKNLKRRMANSRAGRFSKSRRLLPRFAARFPITLCSE